MMALYMQALLGGMLIGLSAVLLLLLNGRVAGISGIVGRLLDGKQISGNLLFIIGLLMGPVVYAWIFGAFPATDIAASWPVILIAGLLVGVGTRMGAVALPVTVSSGWRGSHAARWWQPLFF